MSKSTGRTALFGTSFLVLALAGPSFADQPQAQAPGIAPAKAHMVHMRGPGGPGSRGMLPLAQLACGDEAEADIAAFQANLASGLNLTSEQQALVASIIEKITADTDGLARMCERMDRMEERGWGHREDSERRGMRHGYGMGGAMDDDHDEDDDEYGEDEYHEDDDEYGQAMRAPGEGSKPGFWGRLRGHHGHERGHEGWGHHGKDRGHMGERWEERGGKRGLERMLNNPALSDEDRQALEAIAEKLRTAAQEKQKARHEIGGLMMELRHSLSKEQIQTLRRGGFQQFLPKPADTKA